MMSPELASGPEEQSLPLPIRKVHLTNPTTQDTDPGTGSEELDPEAH